MICACGDEDAITEREYRQWYRHLRDPQYQYALPSIEDLVIDLEFNYRAEISGVAVDQWFGVTVDVADHDAIYIECDRLLDGLMAIVKQLHAEYGDRREFS